MRAIPEISSGPSLIEGKRPIMSNTIANPMPRGKRRAKSPPKYFPKNTSPLDTGFESSRARTPLSLSPETASKVKSRAKRLKRIPITEAMSKEERAERSGFSVEYWKMSKVNFGEKKWGSEKRERGLFSISPDRMVGIWACDRVIE